MSAGRQLYVEALIEADLDTVWRLTQEPAAHQRWDLRFGEISYLPRADGQPQRFRYATTVLPRLTVHGVGVSVGERHRADGVCTSALRFESRHRLSLIGTGSGYWRYEPVSGGVRFITGYDYRPGWGRFGRLADLALRPALGWATAWSFDRLRLWAESGVPPERSRHRAAVEVGMRLATVAGGALTRKPLLLGVAVAAAVLVPPGPMAPAARRCRRTIRRPTRQRRPAV
jgi:hypothetical protein